ncbi:hypothetical protein H0H93_000288 [Arthromyces matolae]|nr:hypothetical protein H0H93_000288 [Arthromyces matolae]
MSSMQFATSYDPNAPSEQPVALPSAPLITLGEFEVLQPPLTRRGTGPGLILILPPIEDLDLRRDDTTKPLDPEPVQKWAEEGFAVAAITPSVDWSSKSLQRSLNRCIEELLALKELDTRDKLAAVVYDPNVADTMVSIVAADRRFVSLVIYGTISIKRETNISTLLHGFQQTGTTETLTTQLQTPSTASLTTHVYATPSPFFVLPHVSAYDPGNAALAHSRSLVFLRKSLGGPTFDLEAIWEEHTYFEFVDRSVAKTMGTMVVCIFTSRSISYVVTHVSNTNPPDAAMQGVSRTVGPDRVVGEPSVLKNSNAVVDWLLPGVPPTGKKLVIPMMAVVNIRGDRLYNEHIWWDQATALRQAGILPTHLAYPTPEGTKSLRLPVAGAESAAMLVDEAKGKSNVMFGNEWGLQD